MQHYVETSQYFIDKEKITEMQEFKINCFK